MTMKHKQRGWVVVCAAVTLLAACGEKPSEKAASQVLAKVNDDEITVTQLNTVLAQQPASTQISKVVRQQALDYLVDQDVLFQKAADLKLDRDPAVMSAIEFSRRQILAQAAAGKVLKTEQIKPSEQDIATFYARHPGWFAQRKLYDFISFAAPSAAVDKALQQKLNMSHGPEATRSLLSEAKVPFKEAEARLPSERVPDAANAKLGQLKPGDILLSQQGGVLIMMQYLKTEDAPVYSKDAHDLIAKMLVSQREEESRKTQMDALRKAAKISYLQHFSDEPVTTVKTPSDSGAGTIRSGLKGL